jgi:endonuclease/exonuclease/phosphatase family metal-dependent hydrolase
VFVRQELIEHRLAAHYAALHKIPTRRALHTSPLWRAISAEVERVTCAVERGDCAPSAGNGERLRAVAWNIQRGRRFADIVRALQQEPQLRTADLLLLVEVDSGMGRSGNRNVARALAEALGMSYAFGVSYLVLEDDFCENPDARANTLALAGTAVLSRLPILSVENVDLPELRDKFSSSEKRLGKKRALLCRVATPQGPLALAACHLDSNASPAQRALQLDALLAAAAPLAPDEPLLLGGDLNTTTYDLAGAWPLAKNIAHKLAVTGFAGAIAHYMTPELYYERPLFTVLQRHGLAVDGFNDRQSGTLHFDINDPYARQKSRRLVGRPLTALLERRLRPWQGRVPARLDWFAGRHLVPLGAWTVEPRASDGRHASDHAAIVVDVQRR